MVAFFTIVLVFVFIIAFCLGMFVYSKIEQSKHAKQKSAVVLEQKDYIDFQGDEGFMDGDILSAGAKVKKGWKLSVDLVQEGQYYLKKKGTENIGPDKVNPPELMGKKKGDCIIWMDIVVPNKAGFYQTVYDVFKPSDETKKIYSLWLEFTVK